MCCLLESFKHIETLICKLRTLGEPLTLHKLRRTKVIEVNQLAKVANKTAILIYKTTVYTLVNGVITYQIQQISKHVILLSSTLTLRQCHHIF